MEWQLIYLDTNGRHMDTNYFERLRGAIDDAESNSWAQSFKIYGMGQKLRGVYEGNELVWLGM